MSLTIGAAIEKTTAYFTSKGIPSARLDAELLLAHILGLDRVGLYVNYDRPLTSGEIDAYRAVIARRGAREPLAYITGHKEFYGLDLLVNPAVLIPRPETELLVEAVLQYLESVSGGPDGAEIPVAEIGIGSGAISIALAKQAPQVRIWASDISAEALDVAAHNVARHGVEGQVVLSVGPYFSGVPDNLKGKLKVVVSNPPYLSEQELSETEPEVQREPKIALVGGQDGLAVYRRIISEAPSWLAEGGLLALEIGARQAAEIIALLAETGAFAPPEVRTDYAGFDRIVLAYKC
ncbi:MAG: peptide chain release factor N(5)-glutamine methyltransferase [Firmicutes bacterium]|nr:peptide chain release factor N(5)-glutamine methyltransferase [Bacillota bacterium]